MGKGALVATFLVVSTGAWAHSWYEQVCCSDQDCFPVPSEEVKIMPDGYHVRGFVVPYNKVRVSLDKDYHLCVYNGSFRCFYAPPSAF